MSKPTTIEEAMKMVSDMQSRLDSSENARTWAQANAFEHICEEAKENGVPITEMVLKAQFVGQKQTIEKQNKMIERLLVENRELMGKLGAYKSLDSAIKRIKEDLH